MEYIKKEELIIGEIYNCANIRGSKYIVKIPNDLYNSTNINKDISRLYKMGNFTTETLQWSLATPEEKHWLNCCITADKFITFEEAMKTFIPEYVELLDRGCRINNEVIANKIYKCSNDSTKSYHFGFLLDNRFRIGFNKSEFNQYLKISTKEAYDAQFIVKEPEFILPEKWCIKLTEENYKTLGKWRSDGELSMNSLHYISSNWYLHTPMYNKNGYNIPNKDPEYIEITFEQFKQYILKEEIVEEKVIEPLPQFKVIESIETITKVENNEGNQFFIGDKVITPLNNIIRIISSFTYNQDKTELYANFKETLDVININKIEHYIEPKTDYKILEYKTEGGISCKAPFLADSHQFYINERCKIYSIKRISDDLIITVGDEVLSKTCGVPNKILSIELINNKIRLYPRNSFYNLEDIIKV